MNIFRLCAFPLVLKTEKTLTTLLNYRRDTGHYVDDFLTISDETSAGRPGRKFENTVSSKGLRFKLCKYIEIMDRHIRGEEQEAGNRTYGKRLDANELYRYVTITTSRILGSCDEWGGRGLSFF